MRALGFCVSIAHARSWRQTSNPAPACVSADRAHLASPTRHRADASAPPARPRAQHRLRRRPLQRGHRRPRGRHGAVPAPTESATVFLQQLGHGLAPGRGQGVPHRPRLRRPHARRVPLRPPLPRHPRRHPQQILREVEQGFPRLPPAAPSTSSARHNRRSSRHQGDPRRRIERPGRGPSRSHRPVSLRRFLTEADVDLTELYAGDDRGVKPALLTGFRRQGVEARWPAGSATRGARQA